MNQYMTRKAKMKETEKTMDKDKELTTEELEKLNAKTWVELHPEWTEEGDCTHYFPKSQFDVCPGCGKFEHLEVLNTTYDDEGACVLCRPCQFQVNGENPGDAVDNWNTRYDAGRATAWVPDHFMYAESNAAPALETRSTNDQSGENQ
jgi:hypothetical protein